MPPAQLKYKGKFCNEKQMLRRQKAGCKRKMVHVFLRTHVQFFACSAIIYMHKYVCVRKLSINRRIQVRKGNERW